MEFIPLIVVGVLMYAVLILPQQRRTREHRSLLASLEEGDEVLTNSGFYGFINAVEENVVWIEVADGVELKMAKSSIADKVKVAEIADDDVQDTVESEDG